MVFDDAILSDECRVSGYAWIFGSARIMGKAVVERHAIVCGDATIADQSCVRGIAEFRAARVFTTMFKSRAMPRCPVKRCFWVQPSLKVKRALAEAVRF